MRQRCLTKFFFGTVAVDPDDELRPFQIAQEGPVKISFRSRMPGCLTALLARLQSAPATYPMTGGSGTNAGLEIIPLSAAAPAAGCGSSRNSVIHSRRFSALGVRAQEAGDWT
jgi:hypothetical protein